MSDQYAASPDGRIYVEQQGQGADMLVLPVPWGMSHDFYQALLEPLQIPVQRIYFDPLGTGRSGPLPSQWRPESILDQAATVLHHLGIRQPLVFGHAAAGFLALAYALEHAGELSGLVLVNAFASYTRADALGTPLLETNPGWTRFRRRVAEIQRVDLTPTEKFRSIYKEQRAVDVLDHDRHYVTMAAAADQSDFNPEMFENRDRDLLEELDRIETPTLVVAGLHDALSPAAESRLIAGALPYVRLLEFGSSRHFPFLEEPDAFREAVTAFIRDVGVIPPTSVVSSD